MKNDDSGDRRSFLKTAGAALVAASIPAAMIAHKSETQAAAANNIRQMHLFGGISEPNPNLPGIFSQACVHFQMLANLDGSGGIAAISDPVFSQINSHIQINFARRIANDVYLFRGVIGRSLSPEIIGKTANIKVQLLREDMCDAYVSVEDTSGVLIALLVPAVQRIKP